MGRHRQRQGRRHQGRRQDLQGRDRLCGLCLQHAARGAVGRTADHPGQGQLPVLAVRLGRRQGRQQRLREIQGIPTIAATASSDQVYDQGYKYPVRHLYAEPDADRAAGQHRHRPRTRTSSGSPSWHATICFRWPSRRKWRSRPRANGLEVVSFERYADQHARSLGAPSRRCTPRNPHWVFATGYTNDLILIRKQMNDHRPAPERRDHDRRSGLSGIHRRRRPAVREHVQRGMVASGRALQAARTFSAPRPKRSTLLWEPSTRARPTMPKPRRPLPARCCRLAIEKANSHRSDQGARRARRDGRRDLLRQGQVRRRPARSPRWSRRCSRSSGGKPVVIYPAMRSSRPISSSSATEA